MLRNHETKEERQAILNKDFLSEVLIDYVPDWNPDLVEIDFEKCDKLLAEGANINARFGKHAMNEIDACSFCGPNDTPLTHAVKRKHAKLTEYLLQRGADAELQNKYNSALMEACGNYDDAHGSEIIQLLLKHGANPNAKDFRNNTAMHMIFFHLREWLVDKQRKPAAHAAKLLLDAGFVGDLEEITKRVCTKDEDEKIVKTFKQICDDVNMAARLETNKKEYDKLKMMLMKTISQGKNYRLSSKINNILRDQEDVRILELKKSGKRKREEIAQLAEVTKKIKYINDMTKMEEPIIYDPAVPFHQQAVKLNVSGGNFDLVGIPYTNQTVYFKPILIDGSECYISLNTKTEIGGDHGVYLYNKSSFEIIDVATKKMFSDIDPKDIDSILHSLHDQSKDLKINIKPM